MELDNNIINIATGDPNLIISAIERMNVVYGSDFEYLGYEDRDGVVFALVGKCNSNLDQIYLLGFFLGCTIQDLRTKGEIGW
jgi:hypothetical protein